MAKQSKGSYYSTVFVEIGGNWFKIIEAEQTGKGLLVSRMCLQRFESADSSLSQAIAAAYKKSKFPAVPVISCIPRQMVNIRILELPSTDMDEIDDMVGFQASKQTPYSKEEITYDYKVLGGSREGYTRVLLAIVQRSVLRQRFSILEEAGVDIESMSVSSEGVLNWYEHAVQQEQKAPGATVLVDIDSTYSDFMVTSPKGPVFSRSILIGADQLLDTAGEQAREEFLQELERSMDICRGESPDMDLGNMLLAGAGPAIKGLNDFLGKGLGIPVKNRDCLHDIAKMPAQPSLKAPEYAAVSITALAGMAMAPDNLEFHLVPNSVRLRKELVEKARSLTAFGIIIMFLMLCASMLIIAKVSYKESRLAELKALVQKTDPHVREIARQMEIVNVVEKRGEPEFAMVNLFSEIHACVPSDTYFEEITIDSGEATVRLVGSSSSRQDVRTLVGQLEKSELFVNVQSGAVARKNDRFMFDVTCSLETGK